MRAHHEADTGWSRSDRQADATDSPVSGAEPCLPRDTCGGVDASRRRVLYRRAWWWLRELRRIFGTFPENKAPGPIRQVRERYFSGYILHLLILRYSFEIEDLRPKTRANDG